jgi:alpha-beta hydrolase superfamily lysophospholipase
VATFVLVHGGGGTAWSWSFVAEKLEGLGHETVAMDLPCDDPSVG